MALTPVYEGEKGLDVGGNMVTLSSNAINVINVQTELAEKRPLERTLEVAGRIEANPTQSRVLSAYIDGRIEKLFVNFNGAEVKAGEPLAIIYSPGLLTAQRELLTALAQTNLASSPQLAQEHQRMIEGASQRLRRLGLSEEQVQEIKKSGAATNFTTQIVAPISGTVIKRDVFEGQYVKEGDRLFELIDLSQMWFVFDVYEQDLPAVQLGQTVEVTSGALPGKKFEGPITFIEPTLNEATRSARVRVELQNPVLDGRRQLYNGLFASGRIQSRTEAVLTVSRSAVIEPGDAPRVYIDKGEGAFEQRVVKLGRRSGDRIEILEGVEAGEKVVVNGSLLIDSQAQLNLAVAGSPAPHDDTKHEHAVATNDQQQAAVDVNAAELEPFFQVVHELGQALASDDVKTYNERAANLPVPKEARIAALVSELKKEPAAALDAARVEFLPLSQAVAEMAQTLRKRGEEIPVKIYKCPMFPRPGKDAFWVQATGPLRNPFYGSEMLECGTEVK
jgi:Cu(I)/Ag(I) efflux system membrane fusion protein